MKSSKKDDLNQIEISNESPEEYLMVIDNYSKKTLIISIILFILFFVVVSILSNNINIQSTYRSYTTNLTLLKQKDKTRIPIIVSEIVPKFRFLNLFCNFTVIDSSIKTNNRLISVLRLKGSKNNNKILFEHSQVINNIYNNYAYELYSSSFLRYNSLSGSLELHGDLSNIKSITLYWNVISEKLFIFQFFMKISYSVILIISIGLFATAILEKQKGKTTEQHYTSYLFYATFIYVDIFNIINFFLPQPIIPLIDVLFKSIYSGYAVFFMIAIIMRQGMSDRISDLPSSVGTLYGFISFLHYLWQEIQTNFFCHKQDKEISTIMMFLACVVLFASFLLFLKQVADAFWRIDSSEVFKVFIYTFCSIFLFFSLFMELDIFDNIQKSFAYVLPYSISTAFAVIMCIAHYPFSLKKDQTYQMLSN